MNLKEVNRNYKDRLFRKIFNEKENILALYNAMNHSNHTDLEQLEILDNENDVIYLNYRGDVSFIVDPCLFLYEHQSTYNPNMGVRGLLYFSQMYNAYIEKHNLNRFSSKLLQLPVPKFVVFYNGTSWNEEEKELRLSDCFEKEGNNDEEPCVEVIAKMININYGKNKELMAHCKPLRDYAIFVNKARCYSQEMELKVAINRAIDECIEEDCLKELLTKSRLEVLELMMDTYSFENYQKIVEYERNKAEIENQELKSKLAEREEEKQQLESKLTEREEEKQQLESKLTEREEEKQQLQEEKQNLILLSIEMALKMTGDEELSINEVAEKVPNLTVEEIKSIWDEYKKNKHI